MSFLFDSLFNDDFDDFFYPSFRPIRGRHHHFLDDESSQKCCRKGNKRNDKLCVRKCDDDSLINPFFGFGRMDIKENKENYEVHADLPGMKKEEINVNVKDNILTIDCERKEEKKEEDDDNNYHYVERHFGTFKRSMTVPNDIDADHITAEYMDGVLKLVLPKQKVPEEKSTKININ